MRLNIHGRIKWLLLGISLFLIVLAMILIYKTYSVRKSYDEQTVMAGEYFENGNYNEAIIAYNKALSMKYGDKEFLSIGLAEAYVASNNYDKALEVLRNRYQVSGTIAIKEKIEEITAQRTEHNFFQAMSYGDTYFSNGEYNNAIIEYEKAKLIKSKEAVSYIKIVKSYMAMDEYDLAEAEILGGLTLTESQELERLRTKVENEQKNLQYESLLSKASEYINQENYEDAINQYNEAIWIMPDNDKAYNQMAEVYILNEDYETAKYLLQNYLRSHNSEASQEILSKSTKLIAQRAKKEELLNELYTAIGVTDIGLLTDIMKDSFFVEEIAAKAPLYYSPSGDINTSYGYGMLVLDESNVYVGGFKKKMRTGIGVLFTLMEDENEEGYYYYYQGEWSYDVPNGIGKTYKETHTIDNKGGNQQKNTTITSGLFAYGLENGGMQKIFLVDDVEIARVNYIVNEGKPKYLMDNHDNVILTEVPNHYVIGELYKNGVATGEYYTVENGTVFAVKNYNE